MPVLPVVRRFAAAVALGGICLVSASPSRAASEPRPAMLDPWTGAHGGAPDWSKVHPDEFVRAFTIALDDERAELRALVANPAPPTFDNTIAAMERAGSERERVETLFNVHAGTLNLGPMPAIQKQVAPILAAFEDEITQNAPLFARIEAVYAARQTSGLTPEQQRLAWHYYTRFVRAGARLDAGKKARLAAINTRLATLFTQFSQNVLDDETRRFTLIEDASGLAGVPDDVRAAAARAATDRGFAGKWLIANTRSSVEPFLSFAENRDLRQKVWTTFIMRGDNRDSTDNSAIVTEILQLRYERAQLLGYANHAAWRVEPQMAGTPERALDLMLQVWKPAVAQVHADVAAMQEIADAEGAGFRLQPWDYRFYAEKLRKKLYDLDFNDVKPYLQLEKLREGMFWAAGQLYGLHFTPQPGFPTQHPDVRVWEVTGDAGAHVGYWYFDPYARAGKRSGAWMNAYRNQEAFDGAVTPIVSNNSNFVKGADGAPVLISWSDAETMFHEFGHALHGLQSHVQYPTLAGTSVARDFVEFPSQINEHWLSTPEVLQQFAVHYKTGKPMPATLLAKIEKAKRFNVGFETVEYLSSALIDMKLHLAGAGPIDPDTFERTELEKLGMPREIVMRHRTTQFSHVFAGDNYSAGYYSYLWADALTADAWDAFLEGKGPWDHTVAARFKDTILSRGNTVDQAEQFRAFRGRDVNTDAYMRMRGFMAPAPEKTQ